MRRNMRKTEGTSDLDILFTVSRGDSRRYYRPNFIRQWIEQNIVELADDTGLQICVPMDTDIGFECVCPPGTTGDRCATPTCGKDNRECSQSKFCFTQVTHFVFSYFLRF
ncbi:hypothetical protein Tcan_02630 [Toxocara canis]|uniref:EGF-like domain-containing protein n=1 Tax=Toxocara canis TaxID=6265 RepID=A0A0B2VV01_TOXCA|nr:hypothetical protein Tcan_02630 [Toxocara canis]